MNKKEEEKKDEVLRFSLALAEVKIELEHPETGDIQKYILKEMDGTARDQYLSFVGTRMAASDDSKSLSNFDGIQANLLFACLYRIDGDKEIRVPVGTIQKFPSKVLGALFDKAKEISGMDDDAEAEAGND